MGSIVLDGIGAIVMGLALGYAGLRFIREYRKAFFENPRAVMTWDLIIHIVNCGAPGYLVLLCLIGALGLISGGVGILILSIFETLHRMGWL